MSNIFLYGGCVIRDAYERIKDDHKLVSYVARQSLVSSVSAETEFQMSGLTLTSTFQRTALSADLASSLFPALQKYGHNIDLLAIDLMVERFGIVPYDEGKFATNSAEFRNSGVRKSLNRPGRAIEFGSQRHWSLWSDAAEQLRDHVESLGLLGKTIVFDFPWASTTLDGEPAPPFLNMTASKANTIYPRYINHLVALGFQVYRLPDEMVTTDSQHKWGPAPYHYGEDAYQWMSTQMVKQLRH